MAIGDFGALLDSQIFGQDENHAPTLCKRTKNIVLLAANKPATAIPYVRSIAISDAGIINPTPIDDLSLGGGSGRDMGLIHWHENVFVVYANDAAGHGDLWTVACNDAGTITDPPLGELRIGGAINIARRTMLFKPHPHILLTGAAAATDSATCQTVIVSDAGALPDSVTDSLYVPIRPSCQCFRQGSGNQILNLCPKSAVYQIYSFTCTSGGELSDSPTDTWADIATLSDRSPLCKITNTVYALLFRDEDWTCNIHTFSINPDGTINKTWIDSEQVDPTSEGHFHMMEMGAGYFLLVHRRTALESTLKTYFIAPDGTIQDGAIDSMTRATTNWGNPWLEHLDGNIWTLTYQDGNQIVRIDTFEVEMPEPERAHHELIIGIGP